MWDRVRLERRTPAPGRVRRQGRQWVGSGSAVRTEADGGGGGQVRTPWQGVLTLAPALVLALVVALDLANGTEPVLGLVVIAPLLAANVVGPRATTLHAVAALAAGALLGVVDGQYADHTVAPS